jgi:hypothetical protein
MESVRKDNLPERAGKKWEPEEEVYVLKRISQGANHITIAAECQRKVGGISAHIREMACRFVKSGKSIEEVSRITGLLESDIEEALKLREKSAQIKLERAKEPSPKLKQTFLPFLVEPRKTTESDTVALLTEIRDLLKELVKNTSPQT